MTNRAMTVGVTDISPSSPPAGLGARILAVVPCLNEAAMIEACLTSLMNDASDIELIVMDGGSNDGTQAIVIALQDRFPQIILRHNPRRSQAAALNIAAADEATSRDILIRCDAHAVYPPGFLLAVAQRLIETECDSLVVPMDAVPGPSPTIIGRANALLADTRFGAGGSAHRGGRRSGFVDHGHHAGFRRERFTALGGYDESLIANEDAEYDTRLLADGGRIWLDADIRIQYIPRQSLLGLWKQYFRYGQGRALHVRRHRQPLKLRQWIPIGHTAALVLSLVAAPLWPLTLIYPATYLLILALFGLYKAIAASAPCALLAPAVLGTEHLAWGLGFLRASLNTQRPR
ncbi:glycosyltransferase family 2 protein [Parvularcula sp. LCG005]|uniref:glycosyltransferase family 2 protein n=1 Tax=Parvularcula sp. LCG005 TaxID=3078805 RepID=UPI00294238E5|nr:glycosyltransferase family 2 protein [Parvularcula sp. LCG005]WOI53879.1 glycosyltransferase family 2 protein [Parvularcula sp. LCG005]